MRNLLLAAGLLLATTPAFADSLQERTKWENEITAQSQVFVSTAPCGYVGFDADHERADAHLKAVFSTASSRGVAPAYADSYASLQLTAAMTQMKVHYNPAAAPEDPVTGYNWMSDVFAYWSPICARLAKGGNGIAPGAFQKSGHAGTYTDYLEYKAEQGAPDDLALMAAVYGLRLAPDPGGVKELKWTKLAADKRNAYAAYQMAIVNARGKLGQPTNAAQAMVWLIIAEKLGQEDEIELKPGLLEVLTKAELARSGVEAKAWLASH